MNITGQSIMPIVATLGHAAGVAAGLAHKAKVRVKEINVKQLQTQLEAEGAFIG